MVTNKRYPVLKRKGYLWVTLALFILSLALHWGFGWKAYISDQMEHGRQPEISGYVVEMIRDTMENWQSEFLQLIWQVAGLSFLWYCGSPQSKEGDERKEEKLDYIIRKLEPEKAEQLLSEWKQKYPDH
ncbi:hypothetical protein A8C56_07795 [Niabella ginsenosidivorans]|uniref:Uncharacterized protein n=1 Tax=Niabella ginsenosidivorans TaxID=1176587 RepID=A0A1A9I2U9_9BACT|nr:DUF6766 family protein [Niabella ginsenosidivorans]ANH80894.1 hypothetical protein A8C56_07795 [Niabella ginsenosidivorans]